MWKFYYQHFQLQSSFWFILSNKIHVQVPPKPEPKPCTRPEGFQLESLVRHELELQRLTEERERTEWEEAQRRIVKAQPILKEWVGHAIISPKNSSLFLWARYINSLCNLVTGILSRFQRKSGSLSPKFNSLHCMLMRERFRDQSLIIWSVDVPYGSSFYLVIFWSMVLLSLFGTCETALQT